MEERLSFHAGIQFANTPGGQKPRSVKTLEQHAVWLIANGKRDGECLISHLATNAKGYVPVSVGGRNGVKWRANRLVCTVVHGPSELDSLHTCHRRNCIEPSHLYWGTPKQNTDDMMAAGRASNQHRQGYDRRHDLRGHYIKKG